MDKLTFSTNLVNAILQYLGSRPYTEVFQIIDAIQKEAIPKEAKVNSEQPTQE